MKRKRYGSTPDLKSWSQVTSRGRRNSQRRPNPNFKRSSFERYGGDINKSARAVKKACYKHPGNVDSLLGYSSALIANQISFTGKSARSPSITKGIGPIMG